MQTIKSSRHAVLLGALFAFTLPAHAGCATSSDDAHAGGELRIPLGARTANAAYRLREAIFDVSGPTSTTLSTDLVIDGALLTTPVIVGNYRVVLRDGWRMERLDEAGPIPVPARLASPAEQTTTVAAQAIGTVFYRFEVEGQIAETDSGDLGIAVAIDILDGSFGMGDAAPPVDAASDAGTVDGGEQETTLQVTSSFTAVTFEESGLVPPDTMGAVGEEKIVELLNGSYAVYRKDGTRLSLSSSYEFWQAAGVEVVGSVADARILYDRMSARWFASSLESYVQPDGTVDDRVFLAVSRSADPDDGFAGFEFFASRLSGSGADFPTLGLNRDGVYLQENHLLIVVPKTDLLRSPPTIERATPIVDPRISTPNGGKAQPIVILDPDSTVARGITVEDVGAGELRTWILRGDVLSPEIDTTDGEIFVTPAVAAGNAGAPQPDTTTRISVEQADFTSFVVQRGGSLWAVQTIILDGRAAVRWFEIDAATNTLRQAGVIDDPALDLFMPSIAVNTLGDVVIGYNGSSASQFVSAYAVHGRTLNGTTRFGAPVFLVGGTSAYELTGGSLNARWGDYSTTVIDPSDESVFWTFQEWPRATNSWATQIVRLQVTR